MYGRCVDWTGHRDVDWSQVTPEEWAACSRPEGWLSEVSK